MRVCCVCTKPWPKCWPKRLRPGGSSISDYVDADGRRGWFQTSHRVYGAGGRAMPKLCDADPPHCGCPARHALLPSLPATVTRHRRIRPTAGHLTRDTELKPRLRDDKTMQTSDTLHSPVTPRIETRYRRMVTDFPVPESLPILEKLGEIRTPRHGRTAAGRLGSCRRVPGVGTAGAPMLDWSSGVLITNAGHGRKEVADASRGSGTAPSTYQLLLP